MVALKDKSYSLPFRKRDSIIFNPTKNNIALNIKRSYILDLDVVKQMIRIQITIISKKHLKLD